jgi:hypothetical protein
MAVNARRRSRQIKTCLFCGKEFESYPHEPQRKYCSVNCSRLGQAPIESKCQMCGEKTNPKRKFCSRECYTKYRKVTKTVWNYRGGSVEKICPVCGKPFQVSRGAHNAGQGKVCSRQCWGKVMVKMMVGRTYSRTKGGKRDDLNGRYFRSCWEANYARYLNWLVSMQGISKWEYEPDTFEFETIKRGNRCYTPDFKVFNADGSIEYHEVKGWMDKKSEVKLKRMAKFYPEVKIVLIDGEAYKAISRSVRAFIPNWETNSKKCY